MFKGSTLTYLLLVVTGIIPKEGARMKKLREFKIGSIPDLTSESVGSTIRSYTTASEFAFVFHSSIQTLI